jgi:hypothetical protein
MMKLAIGKYVLVRTITKEEAIALANELFGADADRLRADADRLMADAYKIWESGKFRAEGDKLWAEGAMTRAKGTKLWAELAIYYCAYIPDDRAMNFIAADREDGVYSLIWSRKEIWFYDGENCPNLDTVEVVWRKGESLEKLHGFWN